MTERDDVPGRPSGPSSSAARTRDLGIMAATHVGGDGLAAFVLAIVATLASLTCSIVVGLNLGPVQERIAVGQSDRWDQIMERTYFALLLSNVIWTGVGVTAFVLGIVAISKRQDVAKGFAAVLLAGVAPVVSFAAWLVLTLLSSPLA